MSRPGVAVIVMLGILASNAYADDEPDAADEPKLIGGGATDAPVPGDPAVTPTPEIKDHFHQFGLALQVPIGVRVIAPFDSGDTYCGDKGQNGNANAEVCVGRQPQTFDFEAAFGVKRNLEVMLELRIGLERDFDPQGATMTGHRLFQWSPGVKFYFSQAKTSKLFSTAQLAFDHTGYDGEAGTDFFLRNVNGLQFDLDQSYGVYFFFGEEFAFRRWLSLAVEGGVGFQGRYP